MSNKNFVYNLQAGVFAGQNDVIWTVCLHKELILYSGSDSGRCATTLLRRVAQLTRVLLTVVATLGSWRGTPQRASPSAR